MQAEVSRELFSKIAEAKSALREALRLAETETVPPYVLHHLSQSIGHVTHILGEVKPESR